MITGFDVAYQRVQQMFIDLVSGVPNFLIACLVFFLFFVLARSTNRLVRRLMNRAGQPLDIALIIGRVASWAVYAFGSLVSLAVFIPSLNAAAVFSALGVGGVAIGFAFKDIFQNLLAGLLILITRPFKIGDVIISGANEGTIEYIMVRATRLRTADNRVVLIPNSELFTTRVTVHNKMELRRAFINFTIPFEEDIDHVKTTLMPALGEIPEILQTPAPTVLARQMTDLGLKMEVRFWTDPDRLKSVTDAEDAVIRVVHQALQAAGITIASTLTQPTADANSVPASTSVPKA